MSKSVSEEIEEFDNNENRKDIKNNNDKKFNHNNNKKFNLYESIYKGNQGNKDNKDNKDNINSNNNKIKKFNYNKRYISNIKNMKSLGTKILSNKNDTKNNGKYILLKIPSNDYLLNLL